MKLNQKQENSSMNPNNGQQNTGASSGNPNEYWQFNDLDFQPILSYEEQQDIDQFLNQLVTEDFYQAPQPYPNYPMQQPYPRMNPPTPYLMNVSQNQMQPPVPAGPLVQSGPLFQNQLFNSSPKMHMKAPPRQPQQMHFHPPPPPSSPHLPRPMPPPQQMQHQMQMQIQQQHQQQEIQTPPSPQQPSVSASFSIPTPHELSDDQKKLNHIKSEKKRRQIIRQGFGRLEHFLFEKQPGLQFTQKQNIKSRSEATMLKLTVEYIQHLIHGYKLEYTKTLKNQFILGIKTEQEIKTELTRLQQDPTFNITYKTQQKIRTYKRVVYNNNKSTGSQGK